MLRPSSPHSKGVTRPPVSITGACPRIAKLTMTDVRILQKLAENARINPPRSGKRLGDTANDPEIGSLSEDIEGGQYR